MEKLRKKTFYIIFGIITSFIFLALLFLNIQSYQTEYNSIKTNLSRMDNILTSTIRPNDIIIGKDTENSLNNKMIMDYNFYTLLLDKNNNIIHKISHSENTLNQNILEKANKILNKADQDEIKINCLYLNKIAYNLKVGEFLIIVDTSLSSTRLIKILISSITIFLLCEILIYYVSKKITDWLTMPVEESFNKQKEFIANASHELKTPLAVIMASTDCIEVNKENEKWINNLQRESERMNNLITRLLDLSKSENGIDKENYTINSLSKIVEKTTLTFESLAFENNVTIESNIEKNIMFNCSEPDIEELISIILDNAIKHSYKDSIVTVNLYKAKNDIIIDIINNGEEIPKEDYEKIFERFYRRDKSRNRSSNRYGLGLAIAKNIVTNHSGQIKAFSENSYTTFRIILKNKEH